MCREISFPAVYHGIPVYRYTVKKWQIGQITGKKAGIPVNLLPVLERLYRYLIDYIGVDLYYTAAAWKAYNTENPFKFPISSLSYLRHSQGILTTFQGEVYFRGEDFSLGEVFFKGRGLFQGERSISGGEVNFRRRGFFRGRGIFQGERSFSEG